MFHGADKCRQNTLAPFPFRNIKRHKQNAYNRFAIGAGKNAFLVARLFEVIHSLGICGKSISQILYKVKMLCGHRAVVICSVKPWRIIVNFSYEKMQMILYMHIGARIVRK